MKIKCFTGGSLQSNGYVISREESGRCYIIDPGYDASRFAEYVKEKKLKTAGVILTHHHHDHSGAAHKVSDILECPVLMSFEDSIYYNGMVSVLEDRQVLDMDGEKLQIVKTPGHTHGSICIVSEKSKVVFTGDTVFDTDLGRTDLSDGSEAEMIETCRRVVNSWPDDYRIYPGHDGSATMKQVRTYNTEFLMCLEEKK